jgi:hypothetical protein
MGYYYLILHQMDFNLEFYMILQKIFKKYLNFLKNIINLYVIIQMK